MDLRQDGEVAVTLADDVRPIESLRAALECLGSLAGADADGRLAQVSDAGLIDLLQAYRQLRAVLAAGEARVQVAFDASQRAAAEQRGVPRAERGRGIADQIALARGVSAHRAANDLALAKGLVGELPQTMGRLACGAVSEGVALAVAKETVCLMPQDRAIVDERLAPRLAAGTSARRAAAIARAEAARVDAASVTRRIAMAHKDRTVTTRPAPDAMLYLTGLLPVKEGVAAYASLAKHADAQKAAGDPRSRGQIMADELFARLTGISDADLVPVEIQLVMPAEALLEPDPSTQPTADIEPAVPGEYVAPYGAAMSPAPWPFGTRTPPRSPEPTEPAEPVGRCGELPGRIGEHVIPAPLARQIALITDEKARRWIRRVFTDPVSGQVRQVDERRRSFTGALRHAIQVRDQACRVCGAPIRDIDHINPHAAGGATSWLNGQGLCRRCNQTKTLPGWRTGAFEVDGAHVTVIRTPTGHRYTSHPPPPLLITPDRPRAETVATSGERARGSAPPGIEQRLAKAIDAIRPPGPDQSRLSS
ncbi:HNH endonuclease signature motif containing protein [Blastococcus sp. Marseille-P5729]|uniref:HNH endonuclease n=1 Tax=Blastococcus sp. Marseille-P5729 TaxID=2086582 RepID=UPI000D0EB6EA|nr:HNH endonuclease signature motif containing protein [Blastococcus sp. Marseille-P5729]